MAVGDFGFVDAEGTDGTKLTMYGGGIIRVRPDGTELETYANGLRNVYDVAIDPFMNLFTRGNTNDGGGWNMRFIHEIQTGEYGYPKLFKRYTSEIIPALVSGWRIRNGEPCTSRNRGGLKSTMRSHDA